MRYVNDLKEHMLTSENFKRYISEIIKQDISYEKIDKTPEFFLVNEDDSLFWSFYVVNF